MVEELQVLLTLLSLLAAVAVKNLPNCFCCSSFVVFSLQLIICFLLTPAFAYVYCMNSHAFVCFQVCHSGQRWFEFCDYYYYFLRHGWSGFREIYSFQLSFFNGYDDLYVQIQKCISVVNWRYNNSSYCHLHA